MTERRAPSPRAVETVSACIIARDEETRLGECLDTLRWCDEVVVVVDSRTSDRTAAVAAARGCRVMEARWRGFAQQRNIALEQARGDWALEVDADERITPALAEEIKAFVATQPDVDMAAFPRREIFLGRRLGAAGKYPNYRHRLFRRSAYRHDPARLIHEGLWPRGRVSVLAGEMEHLLATTMSEAIGDTFRYARVAAAQAETAPSRLSALSGLLARPILKFAYRSFVHGGWHDGSRGFALMALDSVSDALVSLHLLRRPRAPGRSVGQGHFGHATRSGSGRMVGVAAGRRDAERLVEQLSAQQARGVDVVLLTPVSPPQLRGVEIRRLDRFSPFAILRGLEAEDQLRPIAKTVTVGQRAALAVRFAPRHLRGRNDQLE
jgi:hypothetical protein